MASRTISFFVTSVNMPGRQPKANRKIGLILPFVTGERASRLREMASACQGLRRGKLDTRATVEGSRRTTLPATFRESNQESETTRPSSTSTRNSDEWRFKFGLNSRPSNLCKKKGKKACAYFDFLPLSRQSRGVLASGGLKRLKKTLHKATQNIL